MSVNIDSELFLEPINKFCNCCSNFIMSLSIELNDCSFLSANDSASVFANKVEFISFRVANKLIILVSTKLSVS